MGNKNMNHRELALFFAEHKKKEEIIAAVFDHFRLDCMERRNMNPSRFDALIRSFNEGEKCDIIRLPP